MKQGQKQFGWLYIIPVFLLIAGIGINASAELSQTNSPQSATGVLTGIVMKKAAPQVEGQTEEPASGISIVISVQEGRKIKSVSTNEAGIYSVTLPAGTYRVDVPPIAGIGISKDLPAIVTIVGGRGTRLDIRVGKH